MSPATTRTLRRKRFSLLGGFVTLVAAGATLLAPSTLFGARRAPLNVPGAYVVLGTNDLGMHCMQQDLMKSFLNERTNTKKK